MFDSFEMEVSVEEDFFVIVCIFYIKSYNIMEIFTYQINRIEKITA